MLSPRLIGPIAAMLVFAALAAHAAGPSTLPAPSDPTFSALRVDGSSAAGQLLGFEADGTVLLKPPEGEPIRLPVASFVKLTREGGPAPAEPEGGIVLLPGGDRIQKATIGSASDATLEVQTAALGRVDWPMECILGLVLAAPAEGNAVDDLIARVRSEPRTTEVAWLANGDAITGGFLGLDGSKVRLKGPGGPINLDRSGVRAVGFDPSLIAIPQAGASSWSITLVDGSRLEAGDLQFEAGAIRAKARAGPAIRFALADLARLHALHPGIAYLSDREATAQQYVPYLGQVRPYRRDLAVDGRPLRLGGQPHDRGIGTQSRTLLAYRLQPEDRRFQALVGLDDRAGPLGSVAFRVLLDGKVALALPPMAPGDPPRAVDVELGGARLLILATEFGERGDVQDHADWVEARIVR